MPNHSVTQNDGSVIVAALRGHERVMRLVLGLCLLVAACSMQNLDGLTAGLRASDGDAPPRDDGHGGDGGDPSDEGGAQAGGAFGGGGSDGDSGDTCDATWCGETCADLTSNADNCGACGFVCETTCVAGSCELLKLPGVHGAHIDSYPGDPWLYFTAAETSVHRIRRDGAAHDVMKNGAGLVPFGIHVDDKHLYWTTLGDGIVARMDKTDAGGEVDFIQLPKDGGSTWGIAGGSGFVLWAQDNGTKLGFALKSSATVVDVLDVKSLIWDVACDGSTMFWTNGSEVASVSLLTQSNTIATRDAGDAPHALALDHDVLYTLGASGGIFASTARTPKATWVGAVDDHDINPALDMGAHDGVVYAIARGVSELDLPGRLQRIEAGRPSEVVAVGANSNELFSGLMVDGQAVYWLAVDTSQGATKPTTRVLKHAL